MTNANKTQNTRRNVETDGVIAAALVRDVRRVAKQIFRRRRGDDDQTDVCRVEAGAVQSFLRGRRGVVRYRLTGLKDSPRSYSSSLRDPLVARVDELRDFDVAQGRLRRDAPQLSTVLSSVAWCRVRGACLIAGACRPVVSCSSVATSAHLAGMAAAVVLLLGDSVSNCTSGTSQ